MRCIVKVAIPVESGNAGIAAGTMGPTLGKVLEQLQPEASYFYVENGKRTALLVVNMTSPVEMPALVEPFFLSLNAEVSITPVMVAEELKQGLAGLQAALDTLGISPAPAPAR